MRPDPVWLSMSWLLPRWLLDWAIAVIEDAHDLWDDEDEMEDAA